MAAATDGCAAAGTGVFPEAGPAAGDVDKRRHAPLAPLSFEKQEAEAVRAQIRAEAPHRLFGGGPVPQQGIKHRVRLDHEMRDPLHSDKGKAP